VRYTLVFPPPVASSGRWYGNLSYLVELMRSLDVYIDVGEGSWLEEDGDSPPPLVCAYALALAGVCVSLVQELLLSLSLLSSMSEDVTTRGTRDELVSYALSLLIATYN
jgi:hypothetical protein